MSVNWPLYRQKALPEIAAARKAPDRAEDLIDQWR